MKDKKLYVLLLFILFSGCTIYYGHPFKTEQESYADIASCSPQANLPGQLYENLRNNCMIGKGHHIIPFDQVQNFLAIANERGKYLDLSKDVKDNPSSFSWPGMDFFTDNKGSVQVQSVVPNSPAFKGGIQVGDIIKKIDDHDIVSFWDARYFSVKHAPSNPIKFDLVRNKIGQTLLVLPVRFSEAEKILEENIASDPKDYVSYLSLGQFYMALEKWGKAISSLNKALIIKPDNYHTHNQLFAAYFNAKKGLDAFRHLKEAERLAERENHPEALAEIKKNLQVVSYSYGNNVINQESEPQIVKASPPSGSAPPSPQPPPSQQKTKSRLATGTGVLYGSQNYIVTNYHVVKGTGKIRVKFINEEVIEANLVAKDMQNDVAILKLAQTPSIQSREVQFGDSSGARLGDKVFTVGYPSISIMGERPKYTEGVISALTGLRDDPTVFQITVPVQPGNSGGPLFNEKGEVIGLTTSSLSLQAIESMGAVPQNVNYAKKSAFVKNLLGTVPEVLVSNRGIVVVPTEPNSRADFIEMASKNVVLILGEVE